MTTTERFDNPATAAAPPAGAAGDEERYRRFELLVNSPALFNAVVTAVELDIFAFLARTPGVTAEQLLSSPDLRRIRCEC